MAENNKNTHDSSETPKGNNLKNNNQIEISEICHVSPFTRTIVDIHNLDTFLSKNKNHGVCGSKNLGNTDFINSSIACLSNCLELTTFFLTKKFKASINKKNDQGLQGKLAYAWFDLLKQYWTSKTKFGDPSNIESMIAKKEKKFGGPEPQDSKEFITEFLSLLSEDLNKSLKKEYQELKEKGKDETELECAKRFWNLHLQRNDSIISDLYSGLLKYNISCSECGFNNITFYPFNILDLAIPSQSYIREKLSTHMDISVYYIPKYCFGTSCCIKINVKKGIKYKDIVEKINEINDFEYKLDKLIFVKVSDSRFINMVNLNEIINNKREFIFIFDDQRKNENTKIIPLYIYNSQNLSAFPRVLFLEENSIFEDLKRQIYYYARNFIISPYTKKEGLDEDSISNKLSQLKNKNAIKKEEKDTYMNDLITSINQEYNQIFIENKKIEELNEYFNDFPFKITLTKNSEDENHITLFDGKNNFESLKELNITTDENSIKSLIDNKDYGLNLILNPNSKYCIPTINLNKCDVFKGKDIGRDEIKITGITLYDVFDYFYSDKNIEKVNEWKCGNCKKIVNITKMVSLFYLPKILIICLKRFIKRVIGYGKDDTLINFPIENLDMGKYICGPDKDYSKYDLFAVCQHNGSIGHGHYTAVCKNIDGNWYSYNDSSVSLSSGSSTISKDAYILFYRRKSW